MVNPHYATVLGFITIPKNETGDIVAAVKTRYTDLVLTGLVVDIPSESWVYLDALESGYDRVRTTTTDGEECFIYVNK